MCCLCGVHVKTYIGTTGIGYYTAFSCTCITILQANIHIAGASPPASTRADLRVREHGGFHPGMTQPGHGSYRDKRNPQTELTCSVPSCAELTA